MARNTKTTNRPTISALGTARATAIRKIDIARERLVRLDTGTTSAPGDLKEIIVALRQNLKHELDSL